MACVKYDIFRVLGFMQCVHQYKLLIEFHCQQICAHHHYHHRHHHHYHSRGTACVQHLRNFNYRSNVLTRSYTYFVLDTVIHCLVCLVGLSACLSTDLAIVWPSFYILYSISVQSGTIVCVGLGVCLCQQ